MKRAEDSHASFPSTRLPLILRAAHDPAALEEVMREYWRAMRHFLVCLGVPLPKAEDVVQEFCLKKVLKRELLAQFDPQRGRFRPFLRVALKRFAIDCGCFDAADKLGGGATVSLDAPPFPDPAAEQVAVDVSDVEWARDLVKQTVQRMRRVCTVQQWQVFLGRVWGPLTEDAAIVPYDELQRQLKLRSAKEVANVLVRAKKRFAAALHAVVGEYATTEADVRDELTELRRVLLSRPAGEWRELAGEPLPAHPAASDEGLDTVDSSSLAAALQIDADAGGNAEFLEFYLSRPLSELPGVGKRGVSPRPDGPALAEGKLTLGDLLQQPQPALELLQQVKLATRRESKRKEASMPRRTAEALYFTTIAVALVRCGESISSSPADVLRSGFDLLLGCDWLPGWQREVLLAARQRLETRE